MIVVSLEKKGFDFDINKSYLGGPYDNEYSTTYIAIEDQNILGILEIDCPKKHKYGKTISSVGTMVRKAYRKRGVGKALWSKMIEEQNPNYIKVNTISDTGFTLIESLQKDFPSVKWTHRPLLGAKSLKK